MTAAKFCLHAGILAAIMAASGCGGRPAEKPAKHITQRIDQLIGDLQSDNPITVEVAAAQFRGGGLPAAEMQKALPYLEAAAEKWSKQRRLKTLLDRAIQAAKRAKP